MIHLYTLQVEGKEDIEGLTMKEVADIVAKDDLLNSTNQIRIFTIHPTFGEVQLSVNKIFAEVKRQLSL